MAPRATTASAATPMRIGFRPPPDVGAGVICTATGVPEPATNVSTAAAVGDAVAAGAAVGGAGVGSSVGSSVGGAVTEVAGGAVRTGVGRAVGGGGVVVSVGVLTACPTIDLCMDGLMAHG